MIGSVIKAMRGTIGPDGMGELLAAMGMTVSIQPVIGMQEAELAFQRAARGALQAGAKLHQMTGTTKTGERLEALFILIPCPAAETVPLTTAKAVA